MFIVNNFPDKKKINCNYSPLNKNRVTKKSRFEGIKNIQLECYHFSYHSKLKEIGITTIRFEEEEHGNLRTGIQGINWPRLPIGKLQIS